LGSARTGIKEAQPWKGGDLLVSILWIILIVIIVLVVLGFFGRGRF